MDVLKQLFNGRPAWFMRAALILAVCIPFFLPLLGQTQTGGTDFDHARTGFVLDSRHQDVRCETCHTKGLFKGTPKDCGSCHGWNNPRATMVKSMQHLPTSAACETCHTASMARFQDAVFSHALVQPNSCSTCHSGQYPGIKTNPKDATHLNALASGQSCGTCHTTLSFGTYKAPSNHIPVAPGAACQACHNLSDLGQMPSMTAIHANAPSTSTNCEVCHSATNAARFNTAKMVPAIVAPPANHIPMGALGCASCHVGGNSSLTLPVTEASKFSNSAFSHSGISTGCDACHGASITSSSFYGVIPKNIAALSPAHLPTTASCETCHINSIPSGLVTVDGANAGAATFANAQFSHGGISSNCVSCHGPTVTGTTFYGVSNIIVMPP
ncbi:MAG: hypothetical protein RL300_690, partial [Pseudomonadota bacterium]